MRRSTCFLSLALCTLLAVKVSWGVDLTAGPMVGHVTDKSARVWMQFPIAGEVTITTYEVDRGGSPVSSLRVGLEGPTPFVCDVPVSGLQPEKTYRLEVKFEDQPVKLPEVVIRTAPIMGDEATFSLAFGSGVAVSPMPAAAAGSATRRAAPPAQATPARHAMPIFQSITALKPRLFFFLGDTGYLPAKLDEFPTTHRAAYRFISDFQSFMRREPDLQELFHTTSCYALFSDRDFGVKNADSGFVFAQESLVAFQRFWPNPDWGTPESPGCFCTFSFGDVDFFLLDARTFREAAPAPADGQPPAPGKAMLGAAQMDWLKKKLGESKASFKVVAAPCTLWGDDAQHPDADSWSRYPAEQRDFLEWLAANHIDGIFALAGNSAVGQLTRLEPQKPGGTNLRYPLFTLGCSTLVRTPEAPAEEPLPNTHRIGTVVAGNTFGTLDFGGMGEHRFVTLRMHDESGRTRIEQTLFATQLRN